MFWWLKESIKNDFNKLSMIDGGWEYLSLRNGANSVAQGLSIIQFGNPILEK